METKLIYRFTVSMDCNATFDILERDKRSTVSTRREGIRQTSVSVNSMYTPPL